MERNLNTHPPTIYADQPVGFLSNGGVRRYLIEAESTTGFIAWKTAEGTILVSHAAQTSIARTPSLTFWSCAAYTDTTPTGHIIALDCHDNSLTTVGVHALSALKYLDVSFNQLSKLDLSGLVELQVLDADNNQLANLEVRQLHALRVLNCANNRLAALDVSGLSALQVLDCTGNFIRALKTDGCSALQDWDGASV